MNPDYTINDGHLPPKKPISLFQAFFTTVYILLWDMAVYSLLVPIFGTIVGGWVARYMEASPKFELILVMVSTLAFMYLMLCLVGETLYWKHLFAFNKFYSFLLQIRDGINVIVIFTCLLGLATTVEAMITQDKAMKTENVSEGVLYVFLKSIWNYFELDLEIWEALGIGPTIEIQSEDECNKMQHGATYMLFWTVLTASVAKLIYFNTLFTYVRAMEIFISMNPNFGEEDDWDDVPSAMLLHPPKKDTSS